MVDWDALEAAGHDMTHCGMLGPGTQLYYCEDCGAFMLTRHEGVMLFHLPLGSKSAQERCYGETQISTMSLNQKLKTLRDADLEQLKRDI